MEREEQGKRNNRWTTNHADLPAHIPITPRSGLVSSFPKSSPPLRARARLCTPSMCPAFADTAS